MMNFDEQDEQPKQRRLNGCGWFALGVVLAAIVVVLYVLVQFGRFLGGLA
jgi:hypothetical protein